MNDKRLTKCAELVNGRYAVDVGTDHGYLAVYLVENNLCDKVVACDVNVKPLEQARVTVSKNNLEDIIDCVLSDGLDNVDGEGKTDVIMAGMGGELISHLVEKCAWLRNKSNPINLVLQPMTKPHELRKWLYDNGYTVNKEVCCKDDRFVYSIMQAVYTENVTDYECDDLYLYRGRVESKTDDDREYLNRQAMRLESAGKGMQNNEHSKIRGEKLCMLAQKLREECIR